MGPTKVVRGWIAVGCLAAAALPASAQPVRELGNGHVAVAADGAALGQLLRDLAGLASATLRVDPAVEARPITLHLDDVTVRTALAELLRISDVNFVAAGLETLGPRGSIRIVAGDPREAVAVALDADAASKHLPQVDYPALAVPSDAEMAANKEQERIDGLRAEEPGNGDVPGQVTAEEWVQALSSPTGTRPVRQGLVMLPFADDTGMPKVEDVGAGLGSNAMLPFTDASGQPLVVPVSRVPGAPVLLPFTDRGAPVFAPSAVLPAAVPARRPGL